MMTRKMPGIRYTGHLITGVMRLGERGVRAFVLAPLLINLVVFAGLTLLAFHEFGRWFHHIMATLPGWLSFLSWFIWPLFVALVLIVMYFTFSLVAAIIASPFNAFLAEKIQQEYGFTPGPFTLQGLCLLVPRALGREGRKWLYYLPRVLMLIVLSFIPVVNLIAPVLWFLFSAWMSAVQYVDYAADNREISFRRMLTGMKQHRIRYLLFGMQTLLMTMIPLVNFFIMPAAVIGATALSEELLQKNGAPQNNPHGSCH